jgi:hypothetical protein
MMKVRVMSRYFVETFTIHHKWAVQLAVELAAVVGVADKPGRTLSQLQQASSLRECQWMEPQQKLGLYLPKYEWAEPHEELGAHLEGDQ